MPNIPDLATTLRKADWEKKRGKIAKIVDGKKLGSALADVEAAHNSLKEAAGKDDLKQVQNWATVLKMRLGECTEETARIMKALDKPLIKNTTKESQSHLVTIELAAKKALKDLQGLDTELKASG